jgi:hypothetical protein
MTGTNFIEDEIGKSAETEMRRQRRNLFLISAVLALVQVGDITIQLATPKQQPIPAISVVVGRSLEIGQWLVWVMFIYTVWLFLVYLRRTGAGRQFSREYRSRMGELFKRRFRESVETDPEFTQRPMYQQAEMNWAILRWRVNGNTMVEMMISPVWEGTGDALAAQLANQTMSFKRDIKPMAVRIQKLKAVIYVGVVSHAFLEYVFPLLVAILAAGSPLIVSLYAVICR